LGMLMDESGNRKIANSEFDRAFDELAAYLYEQYRKLKKADEQ